MIARALPLITALTLLGALLSVSPPARAETWFEARSQTRLQLRRELDQSLRAPLYEDLRGAFSLDLPRPGILSGQVMLKLGTSLGGSGGDVDLYLAHLALDQPAKGLRLEGGRLLLRTALGLRIVDGASMTFQPVQALRIRGSAGWLRDTEWDDLRGGSFLAEGGADLKLLPGTHAGFLLGFRAGPTTTPRADLRGTLDAFLPIPLAPRPWVEVAVRLDEPRLRHLRGGVVLTPMHLLRLEALAWFDQVGDEDGTLSQRILSDLTDSPVRGVGGKARLRAGRHLSFAGGYRANFYTLGAKLPAYGHGVDGSVRWRSSLLEASLQYSFRSSYGGLFHSVGLQAALHPHRAVVVRVWGQAAPYRKLREPWKLAQWWKLSAGIRPIPPIELAVGGEYRAGARLKEDLRLNLSLTIEVGADKAQDARTKKQRDKARRRRKKEQKKRKQEREKRLQQKRDQRASSAGAKT